MSQGKTGMIGAFRLESQMPQGNGKFKRIGMTKTLALLTLIALCSIALGKPMVSSLTVLGEFSIGGTIIKIENLADTLQVCLDSGAKKILLPTSAMIDLATVPPELSSCFGNLMLYNSPEDAVYKALGVE